MASMHYELYQQSLENAKAMEVNSSPMYQRFTDDARKTFQLANQEAQRLNHEYIGTEHLLLGLMKLGDEDVRLLLAKNGDCAGELYVTPNLVVAKVENLLQKGPGVVTLGKLPQTPRAKRVVELTIAEAGDGEVTPSHILFGLIRENEGVAAQVLMNLGFTYQKLSAAMKPASRGPLMDHSASYIAAMFSAKYGDIPFPSIPPTAPKPSCETCRFWSPYGRDNGICNRYPPVIYGRGLQECPQTHPSSWCGEYEQSLTPLPEAVAQ